MHAMLLEYGKQVGGTGNGCVRRLDELFECDLDLVLTRGGLRQSVRGITQHREDRALDRLTDRLERDTYGALEGVGYLTGRDLLAHFGEALAQTAEDLG